MWMMTTRGFYSAVEDWSDDRKVFVRGRDMDDMKRLKEIANFKLKIIKTPERDYAYRVHMTKGQWSYLVQRMASEIDYGNFKNAIAARVGKDRANVYMRVWSALLQLQPRHWFEPATGRLMPRNNDHLRDPVERAIERRGDRYGNHVDWDDTIDEDDEMSLGTHYSDSSRKLWR